MNIIMDIIKNPFLVTGLSSWAIAQILKLFIHAGVNREFDITRLFGDGGMPSGHTATVTSLAAITGLLCGFRSFEFAMAGVFAVVVCHDATGVRLETGKQAVIIKELTKLYESMTSNDLPEEKLKEFVGHTPIQVAAGAVVGIANALLMYYVFLPMM